ncbi:spore coat protein CotJB [Ruminococcus sp.]|uniref:spore coat protein CotJB n=1 Tax=Ruminococcus sp. TaxID=41978 RepID=UPI001B48D076|nr:spore coat protein CotJB [Ruminococcus sp.]MBP5431293.1 spore coat protein CotJB [Ruminococcus sp.]
MNERRMLLNKIKKYDFTLKELNLYLDTHPECRRALTMFQKYKELRKKAADEFTRRFGAITPEQVTSTESWTWTEDPWPWERS